MKFKRNRKKYHQVQEQRQQPEKENVRKLSKVAKRDSSQKLISILRHCDVLFSSVLSNLK